MKQFESFGKYILLERIAAGGMAEVFLAKSTGAVGISKFVAIKRILPQYSDNPEFIDMFKEEARIAMNLTHGNVVSINEFGVENRQFFLVMEYVEGQNLRQILNQLKKEAKDFSVEQCIYIAKQVAAGLDHAHRCFDNTTGKPLNITHRDMSPQNIMISFEGEVKIVDFGIAKAESEMEQTRAGTIKGKFGYMSPEQAEGMPVDARTDIFSLGIVLWELLAKDRLFTANSEAATLRKIRDCQVPSLRRINPAIPPELERIVNKALAKDKSLRYQASSALHRDLNRFLNIQYPDFSPQDFAIFMKSVFSQVYIENRKKQVEFAKLTPGLQAPVAHEEREKTQVTKTETISDVETSSPSIRRARENPVPVLLPAPNSYTDGPEVASDEISGLNDSDLGGKTRVDLTQLKTKIRPVDKFSQTSSSIDIGSFNRGQTNPNARRKGRGKDGKYQEEESLLNARALIFAGLFIVGAILFGIKAGYIPLDLVSKEISNSMGTTGSTTSSSVDPAKVIPPAPSQRESSTVPDRNQVIQTVSVSIDSQPHGARIYIDGVDTGTVTPVQRQVELGKEFKLGLVKDGYSYYEKIEKVTAEATSLKVTLQVPPPMGYISISVVNGGTDPVVYIDGHRIAQKPPIRYYGVPANNPVTVRVLNPFTRLAAEKTVSVKASEKKELTLILNREALSP